MKIFLFACLLVAVSASVLEDVEVKFQAFKLKYARIYSNKAEETKRFNIFKDNVRSIEEHNLLHERGLKSYKKGINKFADMTREEFRSFLTLHSSNRPLFNATKHVKTGLPIPESLDWRTSQVTEIKDQGDCGSCWSFSITGATEAAFYRKSGQLVSLSEQQLVDCTRDINGGCEGGYIDKTFPYVQKNGLQSEESYPYIGKDGTCNYNSSNVVTKISGYKVITPKDEDALLDAVANIGPVSVGMDATFLASYISGVYEDEYCTFDINHAVLIVGYGLDPYDIDGRYWIVKNSWGTDFGEDGYFKIVRGDNECRIAEDMVYPIID